MHPPSVCIFCEIVAHRSPATMVHQDELTMAFLDVRQFHPGHVLVVPRVHVPDLRDADDVLLARLFVVTARVARAVSAATPAEGLSIWHSIGEAAHQEVPHLHVHVHPRRIDDGMLAVYPMRPPTPSRAALDSLGSRIREAMH